LSEFDLKDISDIISMAQILQAREEIEKEWESFLAKVNEDIKSGRLGEEEE
jgi:hypothetical protein